MTLNLTLARKRVSDPTKPCPTEDELMRSFGVSRHEAFQLRQARLRAPR